MHGKKVYGPKLNKCKTIILLTGRTIGIIIFFFFFFLHI